MSPGKSLLAVDENSDLKRTDNIAVLITCHNRRDTTLRFLKSLTRQDYFKTAQIDIYMLDDGSTDGTSAAVKENYPSVKIVSGPGNLFWAGGMRTIWKYAMSQNAYHIFLLFNDDVVLTENSLEKLINCYHHLCKKGTILVGSTLSPATKLLTYCGYSLYKPNHCNYYQVEPDKEEVKICHLSNANILLVDAAVVEKIGILPEHYTHALADFDYTLTAFKAGLNVLVAPGYYGLCENEHGKNWLSFKHSLKERINYLYSPKGLFYKEYLFYIKKHFPSDYVSAVIKLWGKTLFPFIWETFK